MLQLSRRLQTARIEVPVIVRLASDNDFVLGPAVDLSCRELDISVTELVIQGKATAAAADDGVRLAADQLAKPFNGRITPHGTLSVSWSGSKAHPWTAYHVAVPDELQTGRPLHRVYQRFRRIVMTLRSHSKGGLARFRDKIESGRVLQGELGRKLLDRLVSDGILYLDGKFYKWNPGQAAKHVSTDWQVLRNGQVSAPLLAYLQRFATQYPDLLKE